MAETPIAELKARLEVAEEVANAADEWEWAPVDDADACLDTYLSLIAALERYREYRRARMRQVPSSSGPARPETENHATQ